MRNLAAGEDRHFDLVATNNTTLSGYNARYEIVGLFGIVKQGVVEKSTDNTKFEVKIDFGNIEPKQYELRIMVTDEIENFTFCAYTESIKIRV
jgi:hypothetical protein